MLPYVTFGRVHAQHPKLLVSKVLHPSTVSLQYIVSDDGLQGRASHLLVILYVSQGSKLSVQRLGTSHGHSRIC
jgi:hypothetical protein